MTHERRRLLHWRRELRETVAAADVFELAEVSQELRVVTRVVAREKRRSWRASAAGWATELAEANSQRDFRRAHRLSHLIAGRRTAPRRHNLRLPRVGGPTCDEWSERMCAPLVAGGMSAQEVDLEEQYALHRTFFEPSPLTAQAVDEADDDRHRIVKQLSKQPRWRAAPPWSGPSELFLCAMRPSDRRTSAKCVPRGLGHAQRLTGDFPNLQAQLQGPCSALAHVRRSGGTPSAATYQWLGRCRRNRFMHGMCAFWRARYSGAGRPRGAPCGLMAASHIVVVRPPP